MNWSFATSVGDWDGVTLNGAPQRVTRLNLHGSPDPNDNRLTGEIPPELGRLSNLTELWLPYNQLSGEIPPELGGLSNLTGLWLDSNQLTGEIPPELGGLSNLTELFLYGNQLTGCIPEGLRDIGNSDLASLNLPDCGGATATPTQSALDRAVLVALYHGTGGASWDANTNWLSDRPIGEWHGVTTDSNGRVIQLDLPGNNLTGTMPPELGDLTSLSMLNLGEYWDDGKNNFSRNKLAGPIPSELGDLINLRVLDLAGNSLTATIPLELASLSNLEELHLHNGNSLTGSIPPEIASLSNLIRLSLGSNSLTGTIPPELGDLVYLEGLGLSHNRLTGAIPPELGNLSYLRILGLINNRLTGTIPPELGDLSELSQLWLNNNRLTGTIPPELGNLPKLFNLWLSGNRLTGCIPEWLRDLPANDVEKLRLPDCGAATPGATATPTPTHTPTPASEGADGVCHVGLIVRPGESCTYPGTSTEFSVDSSGTGRFLFYTSGTGIDARNSTFNGVAYNFLASKQSDGSWIIEAAGDS